MASNKSRAQSETLQFFRGGKALREDLVRRCLRDFQETKKARFQERSAIALQAANDLSEAKKSAQSASSDPQTAKALQGLLGIHKKLAKHKLALPKVVPGPGGIVAGTISVTRTPPYDFQEQFPSYSALGLKPVLTGSPNKITGQISSSAVTAAEPGYSNGDMYTAVGILFLPPAPGILTVYANPIYSYEGWTESFPPLSYSSYAPVQSLLTGSLNIYAYNVAGWPLNFATGAGQPFVQAIENQPGPLVLKDGFNLQASVSASVAVDQTQLCLMFVAADSSVFGYGPPGGSSGGSVAGAVLSITVPSISYDFQIQPVVRL